MLKKKQAWQGRNWKNSVNAFGGKSKIDRELTSLSRTEAISWRISTDCFGVKIRVKASSIAFFTAAAVDWKLATFVYDFSMVGRSE